MNKVILIGRLTKDPELAYTAGTGCAYSNFTLALEERKKDGEKEVTFVNCVAFGKTAETISSYIVKGKQIAIVGRIKNSKYNAPDGTPRISTKILVDTFDSISENSKIATTYANQGNKSNRYNYTNNRSTDNKPTDNRKNSLDKLQKEPINYNIVEVEIMDDDFIPF